MNRKLLLSSLVVLLLYIAGPLQAAPNAPQANQTYYVSTSGNDDNNGLSQTAPFATVDKVNSLALEPGDAVLFKCGDVWRADPLILVHSGTSAAPITIGSYPAGCEDQPVLSGSQPIAGWVTYSGNIYMADLSTGTNAGKFAYGVNQLFQDDARLSMGRWPNLDEGDAGYSTIDAQPAAEQIRDNELPAVNWTGAIAHVRGMRWYILNRAVNGSSGTTLSFSANNGCWGGDCTGWGYFLNNHLATLDREGEWYFDAATQRVYLYTAGGAPDDNQIAGSVVLRNDDRYWGGIVLGEDLDDEISHVIIENLDIREWFRNGVSTPTNLGEYENSYITVRDCTIRNVDGDGIKLATWVWNAQDGPPGWRGGNHITLERNLIEGPNHRGIDSYAKYSTIQGNVIRDVALIENLGASGMGCALDDSGGHCTEDGVGIRIKVDESDDSGHSNTITHNRLERVAYTGMGIFGHSNTVTYNFIYNACYAKGDCGGISTFGNGDLSSTPVYDLVFESNIIVDTIGNTDGCHPDYESLFGFGLYIDHYSRNVTLSNNTVISSTASGILYQNSSGNATGNTLFHNGLGYTWSSEISLAGSPTRVGLSNNIAFGIMESSATLRSERNYITASDYNYFFQPYEVKHISVDGSKTLAEWQSYSGLDAHSKEVWYTQAPGEAPLARIFYNDTATTQVIDLGHQRYLDVDQQEVTGNLTLEPFTSRALVPAGEINVPDLDITLALLSSDVILPNTPVTYTITIDNLGNALASGIVLTNAIPEFIENPMWTASTSLAGITVRTGAPFVWDLPDLEQGESGTITVSGTYTAVVQSNMALAVTAQVSTETKEANEDNNQAMLPLGHWKAIYLPLVMR